MIKINQKKKQILKYLLILAILSNCLSAQTQPTVTKSRQINLQTNERFIQNLSDFIDQPATSIDWKTIDQTNRIEPYTTLKTYPDQPPISPIASFHVGDTTKFLLGVMETTTEETISLNAVLLQLSIDSASNWIVQKQYTPQLITQINDSSEIYYGSFYSQTNGFLSFFIDKTIQSYHFSLDLTQAKVFTLTKIKNALYNHVSIAGPQNYIYIIQLLETSYQLIKLDSKFTEVFTKNTPNKSCMYEMPIIIQGKYFLNYCFDDASIKTATINYRVENLVVNSIPTETSSGAYQYSYQRINNKLLIALVTLSETYVVTLTIDDSNATNVFQAESIITLPFLLSRAVFLNYHYLSTYYNNVLKIVDIYKQQVIYQNEVAQQGLVIRSAQIIKNQVMLYIYDDSTNKYSSSIVVELNPPQLIIYGLQSSTINLTIKSISTIFEVNINVNVVQENTVLFTQGTVYENNLLNPTTFQETNTYLIPIEHYVIGADLNLSIESNKYLKNVQLLQTQDIPVSQLFVSMDKSCISYQADGFFSSIISCPTQVDGQTVYNIYGAVPYIETGEGNIVLLQSDTKFNNKINQIDNYGSFTIVQDKQINFNINLPTLNGNTFEIKTISVPQCDSSNFAFASDPSQSVLITLCDTTLTIQVFDIFSTTNALIVNTLTEQVDNTYNQLICVQGTLFIYSDQFIKAYDYINFGFIGQISIPTIVPGKNQQLTLFKESFLITVMDTPITTIAQYSYNDFSQTVPLFMRNLQIDDSHPVNLSGLIKAKRDDDEFAYVQSSLSSDTFYIYRIRSQQWSNQLYTTTQINPTQSVISSQIIFSLVNPKCTSVLHQASIQYATNFTKQSLNTFLSIPTGFTLSLPATPTKNKQGLSSSRLLESKALQATTTTQTYTLMININAIEQFAVVDQNADSIQKIKTQLQDSNFSSGQIFYFDDQQVVNTCILGWKSNDNNSEIIQRLSSNTPTIANQSFLLFYKYPATIEKNEIKTFFYLPGQYTGCNIFDDKSSYSTKQDVSYFTVYVICPNTLNRNLVTVDQTGGDSKTTVTTSFFSYTTTININTFKKIITGADQKLYIYLTNGLARYQLTLNENSDHKTATISDIQDSYSENRSINWVNTYGQYLTIFQTGLIQAYNKAQNTYQVYYISDLLAEKKFVIDEDDYISNVEQYSDTGFRIAFANSYIYDIQISQDNNQKLIFSSVFQYYYKNAFPNYISGFKGSQYTLLFGINGLDFTIALFNNQLQLSNQYLIQSQYFQTFFSFLITPTYVQELSPTQIQIQLSNAQQFTVKIAQNVGIQIKVNKSSVGNNQSTSISPIYLKNPNQTITFALPGGSGSATNGSLLMFSIINIIGMLCYLI